MSRSKQEAFFDVEVAENFVLMQLKQYEVITYLCVTGSMKYMSCRNVLTLLNCLHSSFETAEQFDLRPGDNTINYDRTLSDCNWFFSFFFIQSW